MGIALSSQISFPTFLGALPLRKWSVQTTLWSFSIQQLEDVVANNPSYKGKGKLTESMRKRLTQSAHCAIVMRSKEPDRNAAIIKLQQDLMNAPLHCFGIHTNCNTDFCKTVQQLKNANSNSNNSLSLQESAAPTSSIATAVNEPTISPPTPEVSTPPVEVSTPPVEVSTPALSTTSTSYISTQPDSGTPQFDLLPSTSSVYTLHWSDDCSDDLDALMSEQAQHWIDATSDECLEEVRDIPEEDLQNVDMAMICDIQRAISQLVRHHNWSVS